MARGARELPSDLTELGASALSAAIRAGDTSCVEVMQACLERIDRYNGVYNAIVSRRDSAELLAEAASADAELARGIDRGWLHGLPHAVKDLANAVGLPTSSGSPLYAGTMPAEDDLAVGRIRAAGAIFIGKTNTPEFGYGSQTYNPVFGATGNAWDPALTSGGSSGGAAVGLATHMLPVADGSDMMGSLRNPAGWNNVIGFRPSQGRVPSAWEGDVWYQQLSTDGPMGRSVEDVIRLLGTMAGPDPRAPLALPDALPGYDGYRPRGLRGLRVGWMADYEGYLATEPGVLALCEQALARLAAEGVAVANCRPAYDLARLWETWLALRHWSALWAREHYENPAERRLLKPELVWEIEGGLRVTGQQLRDAGTARGDWYQALLALFGEYDLLALPSAQVFPFPVEIHWPQEIDGRRMDTYHRWMEVVIGGTLAGLPIVCLPAGFDPRGRPMGIQFIGRMGQDRELLEFALAWEAVTDYLTQRPALRDST
ncbi:MAG: amidase [Gammaproteobacteria bacterium]|nr:amidase [Gammaproteobacteria bacterium]MDH4255100.1 amidase [Gammaproteobacteria bacterium]MDH5310864.1 amidase [Gammaproteobacteria bacterium]